MQTHHSCFKFYAANIAFPCILMNIIQTFGFLVIKNTPPIEPYCSGFNMQNFPNAFILLGALNVRLYIQLSFVHYPSHRLSKFGQILQDIYKSSWFKSINSRKHVVLSYCMVCASVREDGCALSSWCLLIVMWLFLAVPFGCLRFVIVVVPDHTHYYFLF